MDYPSRRIFLGTAVSWFVDSMPGALKLSHFDTVASEVGIVATKRSSGRSTADASPEAAPQLEVTAPSKGDSSLVVYPVTTGSCPKGDFRWASAAPGLPSKPAEDGAGATFAGYERSDICREEPDEAMVAQQLSYG